VEVGLKPAVLSDVISETVFESFWLMLPGLGPNH